MTLSQEITAKRKTKSTATPYQEEKLVYDEHDDIIKEVMVLYKAGLIDYRRMVERVQYMEMSTVRKLVVLHQSQQVNFGEV